MSASEKLKTLKETGFTCEHWTDWDASDLSVTDELIAVVEQLERVLAPWEKMRGQSGPLATATEKALAPAWAALSALEEAL